MNSREMEKTQIEMPATAIDNRLARPCDAHVDGRNAIDGRQGISPVKENGLNHHGEDEHRRKLRLNPRRVEAPHDLGSSDAMHREQKSRQEERQIQGCPRRRLPDFDLFIETPNLRFV